MNLYPNLYARWKATPTRGGCLTARPGRCAASCSCASRPSIPSPRWTRPSPAWRGERRTRRRRASAGNARLALIYVLALYCNRILIYWVFPALYCFAPKSSICKFDMYQTRVILRSVPLASWLPSTGELSAKLTEGFSFLCGLCVDDDLP